MLLRRLGSRVHSAHLTARAPLLSRARSRCSQPEDEGLVPAELVNGWMQDEKLVDASLWPHRRLEMWLQLRTLDGLDLPSFLQGSAHAYVVVQTLMYEREWDALAPLVSPNCLVAMQETMEHMGSVAQRVQMDEGDIVVRSNVLRKVVVLQPGDSVPQGDGTEVHVPRGSCQLDVHFSADESFRIFNYHTNELMPPFDGGTRAQESTWRFEGVVVPPDGEAGEMTDWRLHAIV